MKRHRAQELAVTTLSCSECRVGWADRSERWRIYLTDDDPPEAVVYCQRCAEREFGSASGR